MALWRADRLRFGLVCAGVLATGLLPAGLMVASGQVIDAVATVATGDGASAHAGLVATA